MRTFAEALKATRAAAQSGGTVAIAVPGDRSATPELEALEDRLVPARGPAEPDNPRARCDYCPRATLADRLLEVQPGHYACDGCIAHWNRNGLAYGTPIKRQAAGTQS